MSCVECVYPGAWRRIVYLALPCVGMGYGVDVLIRRIRVRDYEDTL